MHRLKQIWSDLRSSFWFMPSLIVAASIVLAVALIETDSAMGERWLAQWPGLFGVGSEGARELLSTLAGSIMTVMGITFSMTLVALALASSQYTSRILRNFMRSRVTQVTFRIFAGIFGYCLIVLRTIHGGPGEAEFVPRVAVFLRVSYGTWWRWRPYLLHSSHRLVDPGLQHHRLGRRGNHGGR